MLIFADSWDRAVCGLQGTGRPAGQADPEEEHHGELHQPAVQGPRDPLLGPRDGQHAVLRSQQLHRLPLRRQVPGGDPGGGPGQEDPGLLLHPGGRDGSDEASGRQLCHLANHIKLLPVPGTSQSEVLPLKQYKYLLQGCYDKFIQLAAENLNVLFGSLIGLGAVQFVAIVFAFCVCKVGGV